MSPREFLAWLLPATPEELSGWQVTSVIVFALASTAIAIRRKSRPSDRVDVLYIARSTVSGLALPISLSLIAYPVLPQAQALFSEAAIGGYLCLAGVLATMLTLYGLFR